MTSLEHQHDIRPGRPLDLAAADRVELVAEIERLRAELADRTRELAVMGRHMDDLLDRESMHVYAPDMERLTAVAVLDRFDRPRAQHADGGLQVTAPGRLKITAPRIERGIWQGFDR
ncbi:hypothetical protein ACW9HH_36485 [Nocardia gipuzkoensis]